MLTKFESSDLRDMVIRDDDQLNYEYFPICFGLISIIYDFNNHFIIKNLLDISMSYNKIIKANLDVPIEKHCHLELIVVKGNSKILNKIITTFESIDGVKTVNFNEFNEFMGLK